MKVKSLTWCGSPQARNQRAMRLLALELGSLEPAIPISTINRTLKSVESRLCIVIFLTPELLAQLDSPPKRASHFKQLQELVSALYICTTAETDSPCNIIFADWCGYSLQKEAWEYTVLSIPECMSSHPGSVGN